MEPLSSKDVDGAARPEVDAAYQLLIECTELISSGSWDYSDDDQDAFSNLRKSITRCAGLKGEGSKLLEKVGNKEAVMRFMVSVYEKKKLFRKQITTMFQVLLKEEEWLEILQEQKDLRKGLPQDLKVWIADQESGVELGAANPATVEFFNKKAAEIAATRMHALERKATVQTIGGNEAKSASVEAARKSMLLKSGQSMKSLGEKKKTVEIHVDEDEPWRTKLPTQDSLPSVATMESVASVQLQAAFRGYSARKSVESLKIFEKQRTKVTETLQQAEETATRAHIGRQSVRLNVNAVTVNVPNSSFMSESNLGAVETLQLELSTACEVFDVEALKKGLELAAELGMEELAVPKQAQAMIEQLTDPTGALAMMEDQRDLLSAGQNNALVVKRLQNIVLSSDKYVVISAIAVCQAKATLTQGVGQLLRDTLKDKPSSDISFEELGKLCHGFTEVKDFTRLKAFGEDHGAWAGHAKEEQGWAAAFWNFGSAPEEPELEEDMLRHSTKSVSSALTALPVALEGRAVANFNQLQMWMGDLAGSEVQTETIEQTAALNEQMADEVFIQLMKQLTGNKRADSERQGWELMMLLCQQARPSAELNIFLHGFIVQWIEKLDKENSRMDLAVMTRQCIVDLNRTPETGRKAIPVVVKLLGYGPRKFKMPPTTTLRQLRNLVAQQLGIEEARDFAFFQHTDGIRSHRLLSDQVVAKNGLESFAKLEAKAGRKSFFVFKRRLLFPDEKLSTDPNDWHTALTYKQAVTDFRNVLAYEDADEIYGIAAAIWWADRIYLAGQLMDPKVDIMPQILPKYFYRAKGKLAADRVKNAYGRLSGILEKDEGVRAGRTRVFEEMQSMPLFGNYQWPVTQLATQHKRALAIEAPMCLIHQGCKDLYLCIDWNGVKFVCAGPKGLQIRQFEFTTKTAGRESPRASKGAVEVVEDVGVKEDILELVVRANSTDQSVLLSQKGVQQMSIILNTTAAPDISNVIEMLPIFRKEKELRNEEKKANRNSGKKADPKKTAGTFQTAPRGPGGSTFQSSPAGGRAANQRGTVQTAPGGPARMGFPGSPTGGASPKRPLNI